MNYRKWDKASFLHNGHPCWSCDNPLLSITWEDGAYELILWGTRDKKGYRTIGRFDSPDDAKQAEL